MDTDATIRTHLRRIVTTDLRAAPSITASQVAQHYSRRYGIIDGRVRKLAADVLAEMYDPLRATRTR